MFMSRWIVRAVEVLNEIFIAMSAGIPGTIVLIHHGLKTDQRARTMLVASMTIVSLMLIIKRSDRHKPSKKKIVLVTGCDTGLGFSLAQHSALCGYTTIAGFLSLESQGAKEIIEKFRDEILPIKLDITDPYCITGAVETVKNILKSDETYVLHAIVNNAGIMVFGEFEWLTERLIEQHLQVNLMGTMRVTKAFCPLLRRHHGRVIIVTSHCALRALPGLSVYGATKTALAAWCDALRIEQAKYNVKVINLIPGSFPSESNIMSKQLTYVKEMHDNFTKEQHGFYSNYFKRYNIYLSYITGPTVPKKLDNAQLYREFDNAMLDVDPKPVYKVENWRYFFYHALFKITPYYVRDFFINQFMQMPEYIPSESEISEVM